MFRTSRFLFIGVTAAVIDLVDNIEIIVQVQFCVQSVLRRAGRETVPLSLLHRRLQEVLAPEAAHPLPHRFSSFIYFKNILQ